MPPGGRHEEWRLEEGGQRASNGVILHETPLLKEFIQSNAKSDTDLGEVVVLDHADNLLDGLYIRETKLCELIRAHGFTAEYDSTSFTGRRQILLNGEDYAWLNYTLEELRVLCLPKDELRTLCLPKVDESIFSAKEFRGKHIWCGCYRYVSI